MRPIAGKIERDIERKNIVAVSNATPAALKQVYELLLTTYHIVPEAVLHPDVHASHMCSRMHLWARAVVCKLSIG